MKSRVKTWQVRGIWSQQLEHKQVPRLGDGTRCLYYVCYQKLRDNQHEAPNKLRRISICYSVSKSKVTRQNHDISFRNRSEPEKYERSKVRPGSKGEWPSLVACNSRRHNSIKNKVCIWHMHFFKAVFTLSKFLVKVRQRKLGQSYVGQGRLFTLSKSFEQLVQEIDGKCIKI